MSHHLNLDSKSHVMNFSSSNAKKSDVKDETKKLEIDNKLMEWRLNQLKAAMEKEKEERGKRNYIWKSGKDGALEAHARNILGKTIKTKSAKSNESKKVKVTVLNDEPLDIPKRKMHSKDLIDKLMKPMPPKKKSPVNEVSTLINKECWIAIGLSRESDEVVDLQSDQDGNLPLNALLSLNPAAIGLYYLRYGRKRLLLAVNNKVMQPKSGWGKDTYYPYITDTSPQKSFVQPTPPLSMRSEKNNTFIENELKADSKRKDGGLFLNGSFNEEENAKLFQDAVLAWRNSKISNDMLAYNVSSQPSVEVAIHDVQSDPIKGKEIQFSQTSSLTFMEKILLNKHRKSDIPPLPIASVLSENICSEDDHDFTPEENEERNRYRQLFTPLLHTSSDISNFNEYVCTIVEVDSDNDKDLQSTTNFVVNEPSDTESIDGRERSPSITKNSYVTVTNMTEELKNSAVNKQLTLNVFSNHETLQNPDLVIKQNKAPVKSSPDLLNAISNMPLNPDAVYQNSLDEYCSTFVSQQAQLHKSLSITPNEILMCNNSNQWYFPAMAGINVTDGERISTENLTIVSELDDKAESEQEDFNTLEKLEWELASHTGNITREGRISRIIDEWSSDENDTKLGIVNDPGFGSGLSTPDHEPMMVVGTSWEDEGEMFLQFQRMENMMLEEESSLSHSSPNSD